LIRTETLGDVGSANPSANPPSKKSGGAGAPDAGANEAAWGERRRVPIWMLGLGGAAVAAGYALFVEKMHFGPPLVMFILGGMTLALTGAALMRMIDPLAGNSPAAGVAARGGRRLREIEREKQLVLKAIKEVELDYQMRKIAERDYREMVERYRTRAMRLMSEIEAGDDFRALIERELTMRLKLDAGKPAAAPVPAAALSEASAPATAAKTTSTCATCATVNDDDARFCKTCGAKLV
jgi:hypothetical protein